MAPADDGDARLASEVPAQEVRNQLARILASPQFCNTQRLQRFLRVAVERTLAGQSEELKEYTLGREAFDRGDDYDPRNDSIVRVEAQRLRGKLRDYYGSHGESDPVVIALKPGGYVPSFMWAQAKPAPAPAPFQPPDRNTVAVLPFTNLSCEPEQDYFCDGIAEDIINELTTIRELNIVGRTSTFAFKGSSMDLRDIGVRLSAGTMIEGSVRKSGDMLRVSAKIIEGESGRALWSQMFDRRAGDVFSIEDEIAGAIAGALRVTLAPPRHGSPGIEAHELYLKGRHAWNKMSDQGFQEAIELYGRAVAACPDYALPYSGLADTYGWLAMWSLQSPHEMLPKARHAALEAVRLDPLLAPAHCSLGTILCHFDRQWEQGTAILRKSVELEPSYGVGHHMLGLSLLFQGKPADALPALRRGFQLDPLSVRMNRTLGWCYYSLGEHVLAEKLLRQALAITPEAAPTRFLFVEFLLHNGRDEEALEVSTPMLDWPMNSFGWGSAAAALMRNGRRDEAEQVIAKLEAAGARGYVDRQPIAAAYAVAGDTERALACLEQAIDQGSPFAASLLVDPLLDELRAEPRFAELAARLNLGLRAEAGAF